MKITSERVGGSVIVTLEDARHDAAFTLTLAEATRLGTALLSQACNGDDGLEIPDDLRPGAA